MSADTAMSESTAPDSQLSGRVRWARCGFVLFSGLFAICVVIQVYIAGMAVFIDPANWDLHTTFIHIFELLPIIMLVLAFAGQLPRRLKWLPVGLFLLIIVQYATAEGFPDSLVAAIHPVNALVIFWIGVITTRMAWGTLSEQTDTV
jgi:hypothetical protein